MTEAISQPIKTRPPLYQRFRQNPVVLKEMRSRMRGLRAFLVLLAYLILLSIAISLVYLAFAASSNIATTSSTDTQQAMGKTIFGVVVLMELIVVTMISPALTAGAIASERERQTFDLLCTTLLSARDLVIGKLTSAMSFVLLLILAAIPLQSMAFLFGGVELSEILISIIVLIVSALAFNTIGLFFSSFIRRTLVSTVVSYIASIMLIFGLPFLLFVLLIFADLPGYYYNNTSSGFDWEVIAQVIIYSLGWLLISINPLATAIATEVMIIDQQEIFFTTISLTSGKSFPVIAPWISYTIFYSLLSAVLVLLSIAFVKRVDR